MGLLRRGGGERKRGKKKGKPSESATPLLSTMSEYLRSRDGRLLQYLGGKNGRFGAKKGDPLPKGGRGLFRL